MDRRTIASTPTSNSGHSRYSCPSTDSDHRCSSGDGRANASEYGRPASTRCQFWT